MVTTRWVVFFDFAAATISIVRVIFFVLEIDLIFFFRSFIFLHSYMQPFMNPLPMIG